MMLCFYSGCFLLGRAGHSSQISEGVGPLLLPGLVLLPVTPMQPELCVSFRGRCSRSRGWDLALDMLKSWRGQSWARGSRAGSQLEVWTVLSGRWGRRSESCWGLQEGRSPGSTVATQNVFVLCSVSCRYSAIRSSIPWAHLAHLTCQVPRETHPSLNLIGVGVTIGPHRYVLAKEICPCLRRGSVCRRAYDLCSQKGPCFATCPTHAN